MPLPSFQRLPIDEPLTEQALFNLPSSGVGKPGIAFLPPFLATAQRQPDGTAVLRLPVTARMRCTVEVYPVIGTGGDKHIVGNAYSLGVIERGQVVQIEDTIPALGIMAGYCLIYSEGAGQPQYVETALRLYT